MLYSFLQKLVCFWLFGVRILKAQKFWLMYCLKKNYSVSALL